MPSDARKTKAELIEELELLRETMPRNCSGHLFDMVPLPYQSLDEEGCLLQVNQAWLDMMGYPEEEVLGRWVGDFMPPDHRKFMRESYPEFLRTGEVSNLEFVYIKQDGTRIVVSVDSRMDMTGNAPRAHTILHDVTEIKRAREGLAKSERRYRGLFDSNADGIIYTDAHGTILDVNAAFCSIVGYEADELLGKNAHDVTPPEDWAAEKAFFGGDRFLTGDCLEFSKQFVHSQGHLVPVSIRTWADLDEKGCMKGAWGLVRDLTKSMEAEAQAARSKQLYQILAQNTGDVIWTLDNDLNITYISPAVYELRGAHPDEVIGRNALDDILPESQINVNNAYWNIIAAEAEGREPEPTRIETQLRHVDGSIIWVEILFRVLQNQVGERVGFVGATRDISERKHFELQLKDNERSLRAMIEATEDAVGLFTDKGGVLVINRNMRALLRLERAKAEGVDFSTRLMPDVAAKWRDALYRTVSQGRGTVLQTVHEGRIVDTTLYPVQDESGRVTKVAAYARDVTERIQSVEALRQSEEQYRRIVETVNEGIIGLDADQQVTFANQRTSEFLGYDIAEMVGRNINDFLPPDEDEKQNDQFHRREHGHEDRYERRFLCKDGHIVWGLVSAAPIRGENGDFLGVFAMVSDITESKLAQERLRESEARYRKIFENSVEGLYQSTPDGHFVSVNPSLAHILGYDSPDELMAMVTDITSQFYADSKDRAVLIHTLRAEGVIHEYESQLLRKDGERLWVSENARAVFDEKGEPVMYEGSVVDITERKRAEEALRLTQFSVDYAPIPIYWIDNESRVIYANESGCVNLGYSRDEMLGLKLEDFTEIQSFGRWEAYWKERSKGGILHFETTHRRKDGTSFLVSITSHYRKYAGKEFLFAYAYDLTERERAAEALQRSQRLLNEVQRISLTGGWEVDLVQNTTQWTDGQFRLHGLPPSEEPPNWEGFLKHSVHPEDREALSKVLRSVIRNNLPMDLEYRTLLPEGKETILVGNAIPESDDSGKVVRVFGSTRDVTMERQAARDLQLSHERMLTILDGIDADIYVSSMDCHEVLFMNAHMRETFGMPPDGMICYEYFRGESAQCSHCPKGELLDEEGNPVETIIRERHNPVTDRWYLNHDRAIQWLEGEMVHMHMAADITEIKRMSESLRIAMAEAEAANLAKNEFLANMSHEIRTPLNGLLGMLQLLQFSELMADQRDYLNIAVNSGRNLLQILNDILDLSKVESGKLELESQPFELGELLESVASVFRHQIEAQGLQIKWSMDKNLPNHFLADKGRLRQILFNLVGNAVKFTEAGGIEVEAYPLPIPETDGRVRLFFSVKDTGIGIPDHKINAVFDPFTQVDGSSTRKYQGTGLGLGIVRRLVSLMGGTVSVMSEVGIGTTVAFTLLVDRAPDAEPDLELEDVSQGAGPLHILVAEDERVNQTVVTRLLNKLGHEVECVESGEMAIEALRDGQYDCVLMDIQMPGLDGMEATRAIRHELKLDIPVIALTAHAMKGDRDRFLEAGMNGYVAKPFDLSDLEAELQRVMEEGRSE